MFLQPVAEGGIHAALPTLAGGFESIENVVVEPDGSRFLLPCSWRSAAHGLFDCFLCFFTKTAFSPIAHTPRAKSSSVSSGASSGSIQVLGVFFFFAVIGVPHRNSAAGFAAWRPD